ncbi:hypothetical protein E2C01_045334 [Portunus trituberculatus]|uniref:Uncharacterized protein n=1 Tax=Portunus trituberculatus TaxID=210409 RepID=A0A5B7G2X2_PORTR|nr:hypothetical protein [Portunus trituberculatus]
MACRSAGAQSVTYTFTQFPYKETVSNMTLPRLRDSRDFSPYSSSAKWADEALVYRSIAFSPAFFYSLTIL